MIIDLFSMTAGQLKNMVIDQFAVRMKSVNPYIEFYHFDIGQPTVRNKFHPNLNLRMKMKYYG